MRFWHLTKALIKNQYNENKLSNTFDFILCLLAGGIYHWTPYLVGGCWADFLEALNLTICFSILIIDCYLEHLQLAKSNHDKYLKVINLPERIND